MAAAREDLPQDVAALKTALLAERARAARVEAELAVAKAKASDDDTLIAHQRLQIEKLTRQLYGQHSERTARLLDQMELTLEVIPRRWKVIQHVREKFTCRDCEKISQAPNPTMWSPGAGPVRASWR